MSNPEPSCCGRKPEQIARTELRPGQSIATYRCGECNTVQQYELVSPLVWREGDKTLFRKIP